MALKGSGTKVSPYLVGSVSDLNEVRLKMSAHYKQIADITFPIGSTNNFIPIGRTAYDSGTVTDFSGTYDGDGFKISNVFAQGGTYTALFSSIAGISNSAWAEVKNIEFDNCRFGSVSGTNTSRYAILAGQIRNYARISNIYIHNCTVNAIYGNTYIGYLTGTLYGNASYKTEVSNIIILNCNITNKVSNSGECAGELGNCIMSNVLIHRHLNVNMPFSNSFIGGGVLNNCALIVNGTNTVSSNGFVFIDEKSAKIKSTYTTRSIFNWQTLWNFNTVGDWNMEDGLSYPSLNVFNKVVIKIEKILISSYSSIVKSNSLRFKGSLKKVLSFAKKSKSNIFRFKGKILKPLSFSNKYSSKTSNTKKSNKLTSNFTKRIKSKTVLNKVRRIEKIVETYIENITTRTSKVQKSNKRIKISTKRFNIKIYKSKRIGRNITTYISPVTSNAIGYLTKKLKVITKSFSKKIKSNSVKTFVSRFLIEIKSFSTPIISRVKKYSNKYNFIVVTVKSHANAIVTSVQRRTRISKLAISYMKKVATYSNSFYKIEQLKNVIAVVKHRLNNIQLFKRENKINLNKRENKTRVHNIDDGGEG